MVLPVLAVDVSDDGALKTVLAQRLPYPSATFPVLTLSIVTSCHAQIVVSERISLGDAATARRLRKGRGALGGDHLNALLISARVVPMAHLRNRRCLNHFRRA